jgi:CheY-like chemotaxis protein
MSRLILVSDDDPTVADSLTKLAEGLDVRVAYEVKKKTVERARQEQPDLVVLDLQHKDGLETLSLLKTGRNTRNIPVVVIASIDTPDLRDMALEVGADGFVPKPLGKDLLAKLTLFLSGRK